jgi:hypothetical protein
MISLSPAQADLVGGALGFLFTVALLSYLIGDNPLYRIALHIFIGVSVGYIVLVVIYQALVPRLVAPLTSGDPVSIGLAGVPVILFLLLLLKLNPRTSWLGSLAVAFMIGVGTAVAVGGAITGTLLPQSNMPLLKGDGLAFLSSIIIVIGTITTLIAFQFWIRGRSASGDAQRVALIRYAGYVGQGFTMITLGVIYAGMILSGIAILSERLSTLYGWFLNLRP